MQNKVIDVDNVSNLNVLGTGESKCVNLCLNVLKKPFLFHCIRLEIKLTLGLVGLVILHWHHFAIAADESVGIIDLTVETVCATGLDKGGIGFARARVVGWASTAAGVKWNWWWDFVAGENTLAAQTISQTGLGGFLDSNGRWVKCNAFDSGFLTEDINQVILNIILGDLVLDSQGHCDFEFDNNGSVGLFGT